MDISAFTNKIKVMKLALAVLLFVISLSTFAQNASEEKELRQTIETFFDGFHKRDSVIMKSVVGDKVILQSIGNDQTGAVKVHEETFSNFLRSIASIPEQVSFKEEIHDYQIKYDGAMANVWTPYSFYMNGNFSHCGVNNFQLYKKDGKWKIIYLVDTRRREGCDS